MEVMTCKNILKCNLYIFFFFNLHSSLMNYFNITALYCSNTNITTYVISSLLSWLIGRKLIGRIWFRETINSKTGADTAVINSKITN